MLYILALNERTYCIPYLVIVLSCVASRCCIQGMGLPQIHDCGENVSPVSSKSPSAELMCKIVHITMKSLHYYALKQYLRFSELWKHCV